MHIHATYTIYFSIYLSIYKNSVWLDGYFESWFIFCFFCVLKRDKKDNVRIPVTIIVTEL